MLFKCELIKMTQSGQSGKNYKNNKFQKSGKVDKRKQWTDFFFTVNDKSSVDDYAKAIQAVKDHCQKELDQGQHIYMELNDLKKCEVKRPKKELRKDDDGADIKWDEVDEMILKEAVKSHNRKVEVVAQSRIKAFGLLKQQCSSGMKTLLEARDDWETMEKEADPVEFAKVLRDLSQGYQDAKNPILGMYNAMRNVLLIEQGEKESTSSFEEWFKNAVEVMERRMGALPMGKLVEQANPNYASVTPLAQAKLSKAKYEEFKAFLFIKGGMTRSGDALYNELNNDYAKKNNTYPKSVAAARTLMMTHKSGKKSYKTSGKKDDKKDDKPTEAEKQVGFAQGGKRKTIAEQKAESKCGACGQIGHWHKDPECPKNKEKGTANVQTEPKQNAFAGCNPCTVIRTTTQAAFLAGLEGFEHLKQCLLLDNQSTADLFCCAEYLTNIRTVQETLHLGGNGGVLKCNQKGDFSGCGTVWYHPEAITNILSLTRVENTDKFEITYKQKKGFFVKNLETGNVIAFGKDESGLHVAPLDKELSLLNTVEQMKSVYTKRQVDRAEKAKELYAVIGYPSLKDFKHIIQTNQIKNCPVTIEDVNIWTKIYGPDVNAQKGKTTRPKPKVAVNDYIEIPKEIVEAHQGIELCADVLYIDGVTFLTTISKNLKFITIRYIPNREKETLLEALDKTFVLYNNAGFEIKEFFADPEFECVRDELEDPENGIIVNIGAAGEHEPNIERCHRVIKERYRAVYHSCPFSMWPKIMVIRGASEVVKWLNTFPPAGGVSAQYSPRAIIMGRPVEYEKNCKVKFGSYVEAYNENKPTNTPKERTISGIFLRSLDNRQGGYEVLDLQTGQTTTRFKVTELNMPVEVIKRVEQLADKDGFKPHSTPIVRTYALIPGVNDDDSDDDSD